MHDTNRTKLILFIITKYPSGEPGFPSYSFPSFDEVKIPSLRSPLSLAS